MSTKVTVCMASYNGHEYIRQQVYSILQQLAPTDELVISDDNSSDGTQQIVRSFDDPRIRFVQGKTRLGYTGNYERALMMATGSQIFLSDQDDIWLPNKVQVTQSVLKRCDFTVSDCITTDKYLNTIDSSRFQDMSIKKGFIRNFIKCRYIGCCMAFNRNILQAVLPFPTRRDLLEHDTWIASVCELYFRVELIKRPLILYRRHDSNTSKGGFDAGYPLANKMVRRAYRMKELIARRDKVNKIKAEWERNA